MEQSFTLTALVTDAMTAKQVGSGELPVLGTPVMIAFMEKAAASCLKTSLGEGQTSVGIDISVKHVAATSVADTVKVQAVLTERDERRAIFSVRAWDSTGLIGEGIHIRAIVDVEKFMKRANEKLPSDNI